MGCSSEGKKGILGAVRFLAGVTDWTLGVKQGGGHDRSK